MLAFFTQIKPVWLIFSLLMVISIESFANAGTSVKSENIKPTDTLKPTEQVWLKQTPIGQANLSVLWWDVYDSWFYCKNSAEFKAQIQAYSEKIKLKQTDIYSELKYLTNLCDQAALKIQYNRDIDSDDLVEETQKQWDKLGISREKYQTWLQTLSQLWPDIKTGEQLVFVLKAAPQDKTHSSVTKNYQGQFFYQNEPLRMITDTEFSLAFLAIWLSHKTTEPELRLKLLAL